MPAAWTRNDLRAAGYCPETGARQNPGVQRRPVDQGTRREGASSNPAAPLSSYARSRLTPEQRLQVECIEQLRPRLVPGAKLIAINGELPGGTKLFRMWQAVRRAMGYEVGTPDLAAMHNGRVYLIELKRDRGDPDLLGHRKARGELSSAQREWRAWATDHGCPWVVARSVAEVEAAMIGWGLA